MQTINYCVLLLFLLASSSQGTTTTDTEIPSSQLRMEARGGDLSGEEDIISTSYVLPNQIFNDGKPYYARQDPVSGQLDFSAKKPAGIEPAANEVVDSKEKIVLSGGGPNIHDFLNLPVKYSSSKFVYPLVSSSYANLKYQGSNKNYVTNKKPTSIMAPVTPPPIHNASNFFTVPTTKLTAVPPTTAGYISSSAATPNLVQTTTTVKVASTSAPTSARPTTTKSTTTRRPASTTTTGAPVTVRTSPTRKKFVPIKKTTPMANSTAVAKKQLPSTTTATPSKPTQSSHIVDYTTHHPTPQAPIFPTESASTVKIYTSSSSPPVVFTEDPIRSTTVSEPAFSHIPNLEPADVYHTLGNKKTQAQEATVKPPMTLGDIFNSLVEEESAVAHNYQQNQGFDASGNLIEPIAPSRPSPFAMQPQYLPSVPLRSKNYTTSSVSDGQTYGHQAPLPANEQKIISGSQEVHSNEYVSYQAQQPHVMQYRPTPGQINNVVISPGQQSASFVLGSQQMGHLNNVGTIGNNPLLSKDTPGVQYGQVINEDIASIKRPVPPMPEMPNPSFQQNENYAPFGYGERPPEAPSPYQQLPLIGSPSRPTKSSVPNRSERPMLSTVVNYQQPSTQLQAHPTEGPTDNSDTKELLVSTNIRFPANDESMELTSSAVLPGPPAGSHINGHAQPLSLQKIKSSNPVTFPSNKHEKGASSIRNPNLEIQQHEVLTMSQHRQQQLQSASQHPGGNEQFPHSPSQNMEPPPRYPHNPTAPQSPPTPGHRPHEQPTGPFPHYNEFQRKNFQSNSRISMDLPNILPQFRPNAKISNAHPLKYKQDPSNVHRVAQGMKRPYNTGAPPQFAHRRQPLAQQQLQSRYPLNRKPEYPLSPPPNGVDINRRVYRLPPSPYGEQGPQPPSERLHVPRPNVHLTERHAPSGASTGLYNFEEEDLVINDPPQPVTSSKERLSGDEKKLEPVVTLQMLHSQKKPVSLPNDDTGAGEIQVTADMDPQEMKPYSPNEQNGLYVVFPNGGEKLNKAGAGENMKAPSEYQNTPFSVIHDQPQEPILKNKKLQPQQPKVEKIPSGHFPYPIEKPDSSLTELQPKASVQGVLIAPIRDALNSGTEVPIAIAYTPTEQQPYLRNVAERDQQFSNVNLATPVINEIRNSDTQTEDDLSANFNLRGQNFERDFMAPFYPSISVGGASDATPMNSPLNSWSIVPTTTAHSVYEKNNINRADVEPVEERHTEGVMVENTTEKSIDLDSFKPELQGGFKPIYPPNFNIERGEQPKTPTNEKLKVLENTQKPLALPLVSQNATQIHLDAPTTRPKTTISSSSPTPLTLSTILSTSPTKKGPITNGAEDSVTPPQRKATTFETSLAALLFGEDENVDDARKTAKTKGSPRNVPRMGPRSLS
ncbi:uncharacterized protein LOC115620297 [Scaptodrosophila lebanonensis]|uniref:Uncharacterized protein LOC115620297 n=1 Tax=Drosophila lebanonensis TaxID=7225 RepID=A0A6J2SZP8_DROLE|nr:uncharacterized protein LOC115620297 [Scaptodrosophila lebanonensis]